MIAIVAMLVTVGLLLMTAAMQQMSVHDRVEKKDNLSATSEIKPPSFDNQLLVSKLVSKFTEILLEIKQPTNELATLVTSLDESAATPADAVRLIPVIGFNISPEAAVARADELLVELPEEPTEPNALPEADTPDQSAGPPTATSLGKQPVARRPLEDAALRADAELFRRIYQTGDAGTALIREEADGLNTRHGFYGKLANIHGLAAGDQARQAIVGGGGALIAVFMVLGLVIVSALLAGTVLLIIAIVRFGAGRMRPKFTPPTAGGSVAIELVAIFLALFMCLKVASEMLEANTTLTPMQLTVVALCAQWLLAPIIFYPRLRGLSRAEWRAMLGLQASDPRRSVMREIGVGILSYLAILPIFVFSALVAVLLLFASQLFSRLTGDGEAPPLPASPIFDLLNAGPLVVVLLASLTVLWAPLVEEVVFRGALFRHLRGRWSVTVAALLSALVFALLHQYHPAQLVPVFTLGFCFALVREWRGSLIPSIVCHCIHNSFVTMVLITIVSLLA